MENSKIEDEKLQMFFDGELPPEEETAVRRSLEASPDQAAHVAEWNGPIAISMAAMPAR